MGNLVIFDHPLISHKLTYIRDENTKHFEFIRAIDEVTLLMAYEITRELPLKEKVIKTPLEKMTSHILAKDVVVVPIMRAGLGMTDGILSLIPTARVGHVGLYRDEETLQPMEYYKKFPAEISNSTVFIVDPMLATGGSVIATIDIVKQTGATDIRYIGIVGSPEGVDALQKAHPDIDIYLAALDRELNENGYIVPGLGDCGDRIFGTK
ncbi:MAG: uracil phosphoribosyltransferase [Bacilli bacterium]